MTKHARATVPEQDTEKDLAEVAEAELAPARTHETSTEKTSLDHRVEGSEFREENAKAERRLLWKMGTSEQPSLLPKHILPCAFLSPNPHPRSGCTRD